MDLIRRISAALLSLALLTGNATACAGWAVSAEARMACCSEDCPMHKGESHHTSSSSHHGSGSHHKGPAHPVTQTQADACCAASEDERSSEPSPAVAASISSAVLGTGIDVPERIPALVLSADWKADRPAQISTVPRHVLLSVFLV